jgi:hypothetical protein
VLCYAGAECIYVHNVVWQDMCNIRQAVSARKVWGQGCIVWPGRIGMRMPATEVIDMMAGHVCSTVCTHAQHYRVIQMCCICNRTNGRHQHWHMHALIAVHKGLRRKHLHTRCTEQHNTGHQCTVDITHTAFTRRRTPSTLFSTKPTFMPQTASVRHCHKGCV